VRGQSLPLLAIQCDEYCILLLGQSGIHSIATPNLVVGRDFGCQVPQVRSTGTNWKWGTLRRAAVSR
jgi:hypothetical protein